MTLTLYTENIPIFQIWVLFDKENTEILKGDTVTYMNNWEKEKQRHALKSVHGDHSLDFGIIRF